MYFGYSRIGDSIIEGFRFLCILLAIFVPLGLWKLIDIIIWVCKHISITYQ